MKDKLTEQIAELQNSVWEIQKKINNVVGGFDNYFDKVDSKFIFSDYHEAITGMCEDLEEAGECLEECQNLLQSAYDYADTTEE